MLSGRETNRIESNQGGSTALLERGEAAAAGRSAGRPRRVRADLLVAAAYLSLAVIVLSGQWRDTDRGLLIKNGQDQPMWEWFFARTAHAVAHLENPLGTRLQNFPDGVNMMANTAMFGVGVPLAPVTLLFGPTVTFVLVLTLGLAATGFAWYWLFSRELVSSRPAAAVGGLFCGFAPAMISHANAHPNFVLLAVLPVIAALLIRMARRVLDGEPATFRRRARDAALLGLLVSLQIALGEEPLLIFALAFGLFAIAYHLHRPRTGLRVLRALAPTLGLGAVITVALTEIPLWWQFFGPQSYRSIDHGPMGNDLKALVQFPSESLGGVLAPGQNVAINPTEQNAYFGWPLLVLVAVTTVLLWRDARARRVVRAAATVIVVFGTLSLGGEAIVGKMPTGVTLPWKWLDHVPLLGTVLETRFTIAAIPAVAAILALATERALEHARTSLSDWRPMAWFAALALALGPLTPTVLPVVHRDPTPAFFTDGTVRKYVRDGSVVIAPPPTRLDARPLRWQVDSGFEFPPRRRLFRRADGEQEGPLRSRRPPDGRTADACPGDRPHSDHRRQGARTGPRGSAVLAGRCGRPAALVQRRDPARRAR